MSSAQIHKFGAALPFKPNADQSALDRSLDSIPRYLFRLYSPRSNGNTTERLVESPAVIKNKPRRNMDLLMLPRNLAADMLLKHMNWSKDAYDDNLMSWTSSLFFAVQHGLRRHNTYDRSDYSDLRICVVDTSKFPRGTFVKDLDLMDVFADDVKIKSLLRLRHSAYYFGEYFSQGRTEIDHRSGHMSLEAMMSLGLYDVEPRFLDKQHLLANRVVELRDPYEELLNSPATKTLVRKAIAMGQGFGDEFALPVALMLLSLFPRPKGDRTIMNGFEAAFTDEEISGLSLNTILVDGKRLPEVQQFFDLLQDLRQYLAPQGSSLNPLAVNDVPRTSDMPKSSPNRPNTVTILRNASLTIDLTGLEEIVSSLSTLTVSREGNELRDSQ